METIKGQTANSKLFSSAWEDLNGQWVSIGFIVLFSIFLPMMEVASRIKNMV